MRLRSKRLGTSTGGGAGGDGSSGAAGRTTADEAAVPTPAAKPPAKRKPEDIGIPALLLGGGAAVADIAAAADAVDQLPLRTAGFTATTLKSACDYLAARDPRLLPFIQEFPADRLLRKTDDGNFATLAKAIVFQQLATGAAAAIYARVLQACDCTDVLTPEAVLAAPLPALRAAGLSERKASYIADLADYFSSGRLSDDKINAMDEAELEEALSAVRGIGLWTVHMHAMFHLGSPDVLPVGDLGVRRGMQHLYQFKDLPTAAEMEEVSECWRPYRSLGSYYMWKVDAPRTASSKKGKKSKKA